MPRRRCDACALESADGAASDGWLTRGGATDPHADILESRIHRLLARAPWGPLVLVGAVSSMVAFGILGIGRAGASINFDMRFLFAAGRAWLDGRNPYVLGDLIAATPASLQLDFAAFHFGFAYPPQSSLLCMVLASAGWRLASISMVLLNVAAAVALAWGCCKLAALPPAQAEPATSPDRRAHQVVRWMVPALVVGNPFTHHVLFMGQTSLIAAALLVCGWYLVYGKESVWLGGALLGATTFKPQIAALPILFLLLNGRLRAGGVAALVSLLLAAPGLWINGPAVSIRTWLEAVEVYQRGYVQVPGFQHVFNIRSLLASANVEVPNLFPLALAAVVALQLRRRYLAPGEILGLIAASSFLFLYAHDYDLVALSPLLALLWFRTRVSGNLALAFLLAVAALFMPQRFLRGSVPAPVLHWRECLTFGLALWLLVIVWSEHERSIAPAAAPEA